MRTPAPLALLLALSVPAAAQEPSPSPAVQAGPQADAAIQSILQADTTPGGYTYNPQGRRDPFVSLQRPVSAEEGPRVRRPGLEGMLIQEIALRGIVRTPRGYIAMLQGTDGKSYFAQTGQKLADGVITGIDASTVTFRQDVTDPLSVVKVRELKKSLYQTEEARS